MNLIDNAKEIAQKAWSVRLMLLSAAFSAAEALLPYFAPVLPPKTMALAAMVTALGGLAMRFVKQSNLNQGK